jgi:transketolase
LALTRQAVPTVRAEHTSENLSARGAYELAPANGKAKVSLFATGSEVHLALEAKAQLDKDGIPTRVVSVPSMELFAAQPDDYRARVLGDTDARIAIEAGIRQGWDAIIGPKGAFVGMKGFGASAPAGDLYKHFGITAEAVTNAARKLV